MTVYLNVDVGILDVGVGIRSLGFYSLSFLNKMIILINNFDVYHLCVVPSFFFLIKKN